MATFKDLIVWQKSHFLVLNIYKITTGFPREEIYGLTSQMRRAAVSISANIVEGKKKKTIPHQLSFINIAEGSLEEVKYFLILSKDLNYITENNYYELMKDAEEIGKLLNGYEKFIRSQKP